MPAHLASLQAAAGGESISGHLGRLLRTLRAIAMTSWCHCEARSAEAIPPRNYLPTRVIASRRRRRSNLQACGEIASAATAASQWRLPTGYSAPSAAGTPD